MFWKIMGVVWTLMLVAIVGLHVHQFCLAGAGRTRAHAGQPVQSLEPPAGTQATAIIADVPAEYLPSIDLLVHSDPIVARAAKDDRVRMIDMRFYDKLLADSRKYFGVRVVGPEGAENVLIHVRNCPSKEVASDVAGAIASSFLEYARSSARRPIHEQIEHVAEKEHALQQSIDQLQAEVTKIRASSGWLSDTDSLPGLKLRLLVEREMEVRAKYALAAHRYTAHKKRAAETRKKAPAVKAPDGKVKDAAAGAPGADGSKKPVGKAPKLPRKAVLAQALEEVSAELTAMRESTNEARGEHRDFVKKMDRVRAIQSEISLLTEDLRAVRKRLLKVRFEGKMVGAKPVLLGVVTVK